MASAQERNPQKMFDLIETTFTGITLLISICVAGVVSTWLARTSVGTAAEIIFQLLFFAALSLVGLGTVVSFSAETDGFFCVIAAPVALMVVSIVWDSGAARRATV